ncbi:MAG TPA: M28 family metallopeptidase [Candidatus Thermoplasmatota archaeon]|nr:M28 family metallopeptidase [Candidatus Thermoplasmatota archaeon]
MNKQFRYIIAFILVIGLLSLNMIYPLQANSISSKEKKTDSLDLKINQVIDRIDQELIMGFLSDLVSFGPRMTGTYACQKAGEYIKQKFESFNLITSTQNWTSFGNRYNPRWFSGFNIIGTLPGKNPDSTLELVFNAHYDSVKVSPGADDDGSGVAAVLAAASILSDFKFSHTIHFVCFSGEEQGLLGSKAYGDWLYETNKDKAIIDFNADGIGYSNSETTNNFRLWGTEDVSWLMEEISQLNDEYNIDFTLDKRTLPEEGRGGSDYHSFVRYGFDSIAFFEGAWNPHWHSADDTIENMDLPYLTRTTELISISLAWISDNPLSYPYVYIESPNKGMFYFEGREQKPVKDGSNREKRTIIFDDIWIWAQVFINESLIEKVEFYVQGKLQETDTEPPYKYHLNKISFFKQRVEVVAYSVDGQISMDWMDIFFLNLRRRD